MKSAHFKLAAFALMAGLLIQSAGAQTQTGTLIVLTFSKNKIVVAADSRGRFRDPSRAPNDAQCKLAAIGGKILFATGLTAVRMKSNSLDVIPEWNNVEIARAATKAVDDPSLTGDARVTAIGKKWADMLAENWRSFYRQKPNEVVAAAVAGKGILTYSIFAEATGNRFHVFMPAILFDNTSISTIIPSFIELTNHSSCGRNGSTVSWAGETSVPDEICAKEPKFSPSKSSNHPASKWTEDELFTVWLVRIARDCDLTENIGGPIDALTLKLDGELHWISKKAECSE